MVWAGVMQGGGLAGAITLLLLGTPSIFLRIREAAVAGVQILLANRTSEQKKVSDHQTIYRKFVWALQYITLYFHADHNTEQ